jgi:hypothetical protein
MHPEEHRRVSHHPTWHWAEFTNPISERIIGSLFKGENYKQKLKDSLHNVSEIAGELDQHAAMCQHKRIGGIYDILKEKERRKRADSVDGPLPIKERQMIEILNTMKDHFESHSLLDRKGHIIETGKFPTLTSPKQSNGFS